MAELMAMLGIVSYAAVVVAMSILALEAWERNASRRLVALWLLWSVIALLQLIGLVLIQTGQPDMRLWYVNRLMWLAFATLTLSLAWRAFRAWLRRVNERLVGKLFLDEMLK